MRRTSAFFIPMLILAGLTWLGLHFLIPRRSPSDSKLSEIRKLLDSVPVYPNASETGSYWYDRTMHASVGKYYVSDVNYDGLKRFYVEQLTAVNWRLVGEEPVKDWWRDLGGRTLTFQQGGYTLDIQFAGEKADYGWNYSISINFDYNL